LEKETDKDYRQQSRLTSEVVGRSCLYSDDAGWQISYYKCSHRHLEWFDQR